jgi:hypothetical protein
MGEVRNGIQNSGQNVPREGTTQYNIITDVRLILKLISEMQGAKTRNEFNWFRIKPNARIYWSV